MDMQWDTNYYAMGLESGQSVTSLGDKEQYGLHYSQKREHQHAQNTTFGLLVATSSFRLTG